MATQKMFKMRCFNLDTSYTEYSNDEVFKMIKMILSNELEGIDDPYFKMLGISHFILYITNDNLLNSIVRVLRTSNLLESERQFKKPLYNLISNIIYSEKDCVRLRAFVYSSILEYDTKTKALEYFSKDPIPKLQIFVNGRDLGNNLNEISDLFKKRGIKYVVNENIGSLHLSLQENEFKKMIKSMAEIDYDNETDFFKDDINYLSLLKENILTIDNEFETNIILKANPHPRLFLNLKAFQLFESLKNEVENDLADYSFIFRRMQKDELIYTSIKESEFRKWLFEQYNIIIDKLKLLDYCKTSKKESIYTSLYDNFKSN